MCEMQGEMYLDSKINILFLVENFQIGGIQKVNIRMINVIDREKFNVHVLYINEGILRPDLNDNGIVISKIGDSLKLKSVETFKYIYKTIKYIKKNNIHIVHTIDSVFYVIGASAAHFTNIVHVRTQPNFIRRHEKLNTKTLKILPFERWTHKFIALNHASGKDLELAGVAPAKIYVTYGYSSLEEYSDFNAYTDIREEFNIPYDNKIILAMHRMVAKKGYETFIDMIPYITKDYDKVTFLLVGDGPLRSEFEKRVNDLNVQEYVRFVGFRTDIINIFKQIDFGVYPLADTAAMGGVIRAGKILITKKDSSMDEHIIDGLTGYLVPNDTAEAYASYALKLLKDDKLLKRMESEQLRFIQDRFDGKKNIRKLEELFVHLYNQNNVNEKKE